MPLIVIVVSHKLCARVCVRARLCE